MAPRLFRIQANIAFSTNNRCTPTLTCLRQTSLDILMQANNNITSSGFFGTFTFVPVVDGQFMTKRITQLLKEGRFNGVVCFSRYFVSCAWANSELVHIYRRRSVVTPIPLKEFTSQTQRLHSLYLNTLLIFSRSWDRLRLSEPPNYIVPLAQRYSLRLLLLWVNVSLRALNFRLWICCFIDWLS